MLKLTATTIAALYAAFVIFGDPVDVADDTPAEAAPTIVATGTEFDRPVILGTEREQEAVVTRAAVTSDVVPDAATIAASAPAAPADPTTREIGEPGLVSLIQRPAPAAAAANSGGGDLMVVTGTRVNMRSGPSTGNAVVDSLPRGTVTKVLGPEDNGWVQIQDVATGQRGYMAARFLQPG